VENSPRDGRKERNEAHLYQSPHPLLRDQHKLVGAEASVELLKSELDTPKDFDDKEIDHKVAK
jgi:hypothetical protein